jgi:hypothetical protein
MQVKKQQKTALRSLRLYTVSCQESLPSRVLRSFSVRSETQRKGSETKGLFRLFRFEAKKWISYAKRSEKSEVKRNKRSKAKQTNRKKHDKIILKQNDGKTVSIMEAKRKYWSETKRKEKSGSEKRGENKSKKMKRSEKKNTEANNEAKRKVQKRNKAKRKLPKRKENLGSEKKQKNVCELFA